MGRFGPLPLFSTLRRAGHDPTATPPYHTTLPDPHHHPPPPKTSHHVLVFSGGGLSMPPRPHPTHHHQKRATACSFSVVVGSAPRHASPLPITNENEHVVWSFSLVVGSACCHVLTTTENEPSHAHFRWWWAQHPTTSSPPKRAIACSFLVVVNFVVGLACCHVLTTTHYQWKRAYRVLVFGGGGLTTSHTTHNQRNRARGCSFSLVVGSAPRHTLGHHVFYTINVDYN